MMKKIIIILPLASTLLLFALMLFIILEERDSSKPPSALLNKQIPSFVTSDLLDSKNSFDQNITYKKNTVINFFASWCDPCKTEHSILMKIKKDFPNTFFIGINHKDKKNDALKFINELGNPYDKIGIDSGKIAMDFGVYGLPETFIINKNGIIVFSYAGPITKKIYNEKFKKFLSK